MNIRYTFTGHETFHCRNFWLKKGYDYFVEKVEDSTDVVELGVGKNMVSAIKYWLRAFGIFDDTNEATSLADYIFNNKHGKDPFLEDIGTLWLLQYILVKEKKASIYSLFFKEFLKTKIDGIFSTEQLLRYLEKKVEHSSTTTGQVSLKNDIKVLLRTYYFKNTHRKDLEDNLSSLLVELNLLEEYIGKEDIDGKGLDYYRVNYTEKDELPAEVFLFAILDSFSDESSISYDAILAEIAPTFALNSEGVEAKIQEVCDRYPKDFVYKEDAGRREFQIMDKGEKVDEFEYLNRYYD